MNNTMVYLFPGQGSQKKGMGAGLFEKYPDLIKLTDSILGYSIEDLCLQDEKGLLSSTIYTQPAIYVVNALHYYEKIKTGETPDYLAGHSLGEYNALLAAEVFDFETGLRLVKKRGSLMATAKSGGMAAIIGLNILEVLSTLDQHQLKDIVVANYNTPEQLVVSGSRQAVLKAQSIFEKSGATRYLPLNVSGAFHSPLMKEAEEIFSTFIEDFVFHAPKIPVISNFTTKPYPSINAKELLVKQISNNVRWAESMQYLFDKNETMDFVEIGESFILRNMLKKIKASVVIPFPSKNNNLALEITESHSNGHHKSLKGFHNVLPKEIVKNSIHSNGNGASHKTISNGSHRILTYKKEAVSNLGSNDFKKAYQLDYAYVVDSMDHGISSKTMVENLAKKGMLSFLSTNGRALSEISDDLKYLSKALESIPTLYGINISYQHSDDERLNKLIELAYLYQIKVIEYTGRYQIPDKLIEYRLRETEKGSGQLNNLFVKASSMDIIDRFLEPVPEKILTQLYQKAKITKEVMLEATHTPLANALCIATDSGSETMHDSFGVLLPYVRQKVAILNQKHQYREDVFVGVGGVGIPDAIASAFLIGVDFVLSHSINYCTVEAEIAPFSKKLLVEATILDTCFAPNKDFLFESNQKIQLLKKGILFPGRAMQLYDIFKRYKSINDVDSHTLISLENKMYGQDLETVWDNIAQELIAENKAELIEKAKLNPRYHMYLLFMHYYDRSLNAAIKGEESNRLNFQLHCNPVLGLLNQELKDNELKEWERRKVADLGEWLMVEAEKKIQKRISKL